MSLDALSNRELCELVKAVLITRGMRAPTADIIKGYEVTKSEHSRRADDDR